MKRVCRERGWKDEGIHFYKRVEYQIAMEPSSKWPVKALCRAMSISRSGFYKWKARLSKPCPRVKKRMGDIVLFEKYHSKYPSHGYRWLNAKIRLDTGLVMSDQYAHRCRRFAGIKSKSKHYAYKASGEEKQTFPNLVMASIKVDGPMQVVASDMTAFWAGGTYWELALYMDLWNNEIVGYGLSCRRGDRNTYFDGLRMVAEKKKGMDGLELILHTDQGSVYSSKSFNELLPQYRITHSMSRAGTPTDNGAMEAINGWAKVEMFVDFDVSHCQDVPSFCRVLHQVLQRRTAFRRIGLSHPESLQGIERGGQNGPEEAEPNQIREEAGKDPGSERR